MILNISIRDETDSTAGLKQQVFNGAGDAPVYRSHARKPSDAAPKELEPIQEVSLTKVSEDSLSSREDTVVPKTVKEVCTKVNIHGKSLLHK